MEAGNQQGLFGGLIQNKQNVTTAPERKHLGNTNENFPQKHPMKYFAFFI